MKKFLVLVSIFMIYFISFTAVKVVKADTFNNENKWPVFQSFSVSEKLVLSGENIEFTLKPNGIFDKKTKVIITIYCMTWNESKEIELTLSETGLYKGSFTPNSNTMPGQWKVLSIDMFNFTPFDSKHIYNKAIRPDISEAIDLNSLDFEVAGTHISPLIQQSINRKEATIGDDIEISVKVARDITSVMAFVNLTRAPGTEYLKFNEVEPGVFKGKISILGQSISGLWKVKYFELTDNKGIERTIYDKTYLKNVDSLDFSGLDFAVKGTDMKPPVLTSISINKNNLVGGDKLEITAVVKDDFSGVEYVVARLDSPRDKRSIWVPMRLASTGKYKGFFQVNDNKTADGTWRVAYIYIRDKSGKEVYISNNIPSNVYSTIYSDSNSRNFSKLDFTVKNTHYDNKPPTISNLEIDKKQVGLGESIRFSANIADDISGFSKAEITFESPKSYAKINSVFLNLSKDGKYRGSLKIENYDAPGVWKIKQITLTDKVGNSICLVEGLGQYTFEVIGTVLDNEPPVIGDITINKKQANWGETVEITVKAKDNMSGIRSGCISFVDYYYHKQVFADLVPVDDITYKGYFHLNSVEDADKWRISYILTTDNQGNSYNIENSSNLTGKTYQGEYRDLDEFNINQLGRIKTDMNGPILGELKIDNRNVVYGQRVEFSALVKDDLSGVDSVIVEVISPSQGEPHSISLSLSSDGRYKGYLDITDDMEIGTWMVIKYEAIDKEGNPSIVENKKILENPNVYVYKDLNFYNLAFDVVDNLLGLENYYKEIGDGDTTVNNSEVVPQGNLENSKLIVEVPITLEFDNKEEQSKFECTEKLQTQVINTNLKDNKTLVLDNKLPNIKTVFPRLVQIKPVIKTSVIKNSIHVILYKTKYITSKEAPNAIVIIKMGSKIEVKSKVDKNGNYKIKILPQYKGKTLSITLLNKKGEITKSSLIKVV